MTQALPLSGISAFPYFSFGFVTSASQPTSHCAIACAQTEAEKAAWALAKEAGLDLVVINPSLVLGPVLTNRADSTSIQMMKVIGFLKTFLKTFFTSEGASSCW